MSGIIVDTVQKATVWFGKDATLLQLIQALTENLGGEWDDAKLALTVRQRGSFDEEWGLLVTLQENSGEPARPERWATEDGEHVAVAADGPSGFRICSCGIYDTDKGIAQHLKTVGYTPSEGLDVG